MLAPAEGVRFGRPMARPRNLHRRSFRRRSKIVEASSKGQERGLVATWDLLKQWKLLAMALAISVVVLGVYRNVYWRPFDDSPQEATVSYHAFGFAAANGAGLGQNPLVARDIDVRESRIRPYPHWPNGFFLLFEAVLRVFGRTEAVGRSFAILGT